MASVIVDQPRAGLRYLHCSCVKASGITFAPIAPVAVRTKEMTIWSLDDAQAQVRIESCDECHGYTKMMFVEMSPSMDGG